MGNNTIVKSYYISIARLEAHGFRLSLEEAIAPEPPGPGQPPWHSVSEGGARRVRVFHRSTPAAGSPSSSPTRMGAFTYSIGATHSAGYVAKRLSGSTVPGGPVTAVRVGDKPALFVADTPAALYTCLGDYHRGWVPWRNVSEGSTIPGGYVAAVFFAAACTSFSPILAAEYMQTPALTTAVGGHGGTCLKARRPRERRSRQSSTTTGLRSSSPTLAVACLRPPDRTKTGGGLAGCVRQERQHRGGTWQGIP